MKRFLFGIAVVVFGMFSASAAHAKLMFGAAEKIEFVSDTGIPGPNGTKLTLARKITTKSFLAPYTVHDDGFVLGVAGDSKRYIPFPDESNIKAFQIAKLLPDPLPSWEMPLFDKVWGHSLWILLLGLIGYSTLKTIFGKKAAAE